MALYQPAHFRVDDLEVAAEIISNAPFATLITPCDGEPWVTHLPLAWDSDRRVLLGHLAKANPHSELLGGKKPSIAIFHGPHTYITPRSYHNEGQVPTWNYAVVHVHGNTHPMESEDAEAEVLRLTSSFDANLALSPDDVSRQARGIVAFTMDIERIETKLKMSQNKPKEDRDGAIAELIVRGDPESVAVAKWMGRLAPTD